MGTHRHRVRTLLLLAAVAMLAILTGGRPAAAHPLDQLTQHLFVDLQPTEVRLTVAINGGLRATELVLSQLDADGNGEIAPAEQTAWLQRWHRTLRVTLDGETVAVGATSFQVSMPPVEDFHLGLTPMLIAFTAPLPDAGPPAEHVLGVRNDYLINRTTYRIDVVSGAGTELLDKSWPDSSMRIAFEADPSVPASGTAQPRKLPGSGAEAGCWPKRARRSSTRRPRPSSSPYSGSSR